MGRQIARERNSSPHVLPIPLISPPDAAPCTYWGRLVLLELLLTLIRDPPPLLKPNLPSQVSLAFRRAGGDPRLLQNILLSRRGAGAGTLLDAPKMAEEGEERHSRPSRGRGEVL